MVIYIDTNKPVRHMKIARGRERGRERETERAETGGELVCGVVWTPGRMSGIGTGDDLSGTTYSPDGRVFQAEYACKAVDNAGTTIGVKCKDGVLIAVEKQVESKMVVPGSASSRRVMACDRHAGIACAGLAPDGRQLVNRARYVSRTMRFDGGELLVRGANSGETKTGCDATRSAATARTHVTSCSRAHSVPMILQHSVCTTNVNFVPRSK